MLSNRFFVRLFLSVPVIIRFLQLVWFKISGCNCVFAKCFANRASPFIIHISGIFFTTLQFCEIKHLNACDLLASLPRFQVLLRFDKNCSFFSCGWTPGREVYPTVCFLAFQQLFLQAQSQNRGAVLERTRHSSPPDFCFAPPPPSPSLCRGNDAVFQLWPNPRLITTYSVPANRAAVPHCCFAATTIRKLKLGQRTSDHIFWQQSNLLGSYESFLMQQRHTQSTVLQCNDDLAELLEGQSDN